MVVSKVTVSVPLAGSARVGSPSNACSSVSSPPVGSPTPAANALSCSGFMPSGGSMPGWYLAEAPSLTCAAAVCVAASALASSVRVRSASMAACSSSAGVRSVGLPSAGLALASALLLGVVSLWVCEGQPARATRASARVGTDARRTGWAAFMGPPGQGPSGPGGGSVYPMVRGLATLRGRAASSAGDVDALQPGRRVAPGHAPLESSHHGLAVAAAEDGVRALEVGCGAGGHEELLRAAVGGAVVG